MTHYGDIANPNKTPQGEKARPEQAKNNAGGYVFDVGPWKQLDRFLILGQVGPTYYASERKAVRDCADAVRACLDEDGLRVVARVVEVSDAGRAPKNDPAIFCLAMAASHSSPAVRRAALEALPKVCRIGTHLFHFVADAMSMRKWSRGLRRAVAGWYLSKSERDLALHAVKYQQRDGWGNADLLRLSHPKAEGVTDATFRWMVGGLEAVESTTRKNHGAEMPPRREQLHPIILAYEELRRAASAKDVVRLVAEHRLPREAVPTEWLSKPEVWEALLPHMGVTAMVRNLGKMSSIGLIAPMSSAAKHVAATLEDEEALRKGRVHPMQLLLALGVYRQGRGEKGSLTWVAERSVCDALDAGFYLAFKHVEPTGKNTLIALDVSGSMDSGTIAGAPGITPRVAAAAMAMVTARVEKHWHMVGFTSGGTGYGGRWGGSPCALTEIGASRNERLDALVEKVRRMPMGGTDCALPMLYAAGKDLEVDVFQVYTDNETWHGSTHPFQALEAYRAKSGRPAKLVVVGLTATSFSIADPKDPGMLDVVGMDSHAPALMADFARGEL